MRSYRRVPLSLLLAIVGLRVLSVSPIYACEYFMPASKETKTIQQPCACSTLKAPHIDSVERLKRFQRASVHVVGTALHVKLAVFLKDVPLARKKELCLNAIRQFDLMLIDFYGWPPVKSLWTQEEALKRWRAATLKVSDELTAARKLSAKGQPQECAQKIKAAADAYRDALIRGDAGIDKPLAMFVQMRAVMKAARSCNDAERTAISKALNQELDSRTKELIQVLKISRAWTPGAARDFAAVRDGIARVIKASGKEVTKQAKATHALYAPFIQKYLLNHAPEAKVWPKASKTSARTTAPKRQEKTEEKR